MKGIFEVARDIRAANRLRTRPLPDRLPAQWMARHGLEASKRRTLTSEVVDFAIR
ncbi:hypothetical protein N185_15640 [Sinorhizobium sp. GW3]|nr:hypothetical protein N185_15640 [Sinorhizobium sp. GW3]